MAANLRLLWMTFWLGMALALNGGGTLLLQKVTTPSRADTDVSHALPRALHEIRGID